MLAWLEIRWPRYKMPATYLHSHHWRPRLLRESLPLGTDEQRLPKRGLERRIVIITLTNNGFDLRHFNPHSLPVSKTLVAESLWPGSDVETFSKRGVKRSIVIFTVANGRFDFYHFNSHYRRISTSRDISSAPSRALNWLSRHMVALQPPSISDRYLEGMKIAPEPLAHKESGRVYRFEGDG